MVKKWASKISFRSSIPAGARGFTLVEMMMSMALMMVLASAIFSLSVQVMQVGATSEIRSEVGRDALKIMDFFSSRIQIAGGQSIPIHGAILIENDCSGKAQMPNCKGSDRITIFYAKNPPLEQRVLSLTATTVRFATYLDTSIVPNVWVCPLTNSWRDQGLVLSQGSAVIYRYVTGVDLANCQLNIKNLTAHGIDYDPNLVNWSGSIATVSDYASYFLKEDTHEIFQASDFNGNGYIEGTEFTLVAAGIFDFQIAAGYDMGSGRVVTASDQRLDGWMFDFPAALDRDWGLKSSYFDRLTSLRVGIASGVEKSVGTQKELSQRLFDGPPRDISNKTSKVFYTVSTPRNRLE